MFSLYDEDGNINHMPIEAKNKDALKTSLTIAGLTTAAVGAVSLISRFTLGKKEKISSATSEPGEHMGNVSQALTNAGKDVKINFSVFDFGSKDSGIKTK